MHSGCTPGVSRAPPRKPYYERERTWSAVRRACAITLAQDRPFVVCQRSSLPRASLSSGLVAAVWSPTLAVSSMT